MRSPSLPPNSSPCRVPLWHRGPHSLSLPPPSNLRLSLPRRSTRSSASTQAPRTARSRLRTGVWRWSATRTSARPPTSSTILATGGTSVWLI
ncbi:hypothetical protein ZIOFF_062812 [Zingiber officinale]|uniref:Uncharacterized protein n=1 Tax=Zingiber officinale TaxID=94328 RepID=A0A8J5F5K2_ZINOF|nr:hypothetical protein ZIOFF_062812 [Zingiber officinale]